MQSAGLWARLTTLYCHLLLKPPTGITTERKTQNEFNLKEHYKGISWVESGLKEKEGEGEAV